MHGQLLELFQTKSHDSLISERPADHDGLVFDQQFEDQLKTRWITHTVEENSEQVEVSDD
jgi:hypothetical protein